MKCIRRPLALALTFVLMISLLSLSVFAEEGPAPLEGATAAAYISKHGNVPISIRCDELRNAGYAYGDMLTVEFLGQSIELPLCSNYSDVDSGTAGVFARAQDEYVILAINMGDFATTYGIATKTTYEDKTFVWNYAEGVTEPVQFALSLKEAGGYYDAYVMHQLSYTGERTDYSELTDAQFANFRAVATTGMGAGVLYRTSSPINPANNRNLCADAAIRDAGVTVVMNLADDRETAENYEGFAESYYATLDFIALNMGVDLLSDDFRGKLVEGLRFFAEHPGIYAIHCTEGKDRSGFVAALLECLMGATYDEIVADYMITYYNYYGVTQDDPRYDVIARSNIVKMLSTAFGVSDLASADLAAGAETYLLDAGLSEEALSALKTNLSAAPSSVVEPPYDDVEADAPCLQAVIFVDAHGLMNGIGGGLFAPEATATRAQGMTVLARLDAQQEAAETLCTLDEGVAWAVSAGITDGENRGEGLTREMFITMLYRYAKLKGIDVSVGEDTNILSYDDVFSAHEWAMAALQWACGAGLLKETWETGVLAPLAYVDRAQMAELLMRFASAVA